METLPQTPIPTEKKPHGNKGRKVNEKQMEGLRKGMEALKAKREAAKEKKAEKKEESSDDEAPAPPPAPKVKKLMTSDTILEAIPIKPARTRRSPAKPKAEQGSLYASKNDFESFKTQVIETIKTTPVVKEVEKVVDRVVEVVVEKPVEKQISGSQLLDRIFFNR
jgi:hypothetical protein